MKIRIVMVVEHEVTADKLKDYYEATTLEEAVKNQQAWIDEGSCDPYDLLGGEVKITCEGVA